MKKILLRVFGLICIAIGLWLFAGLIPAMGEMFANAHGRREIRGVIAMPLIGLLLMAFGCVAVWRPEWLNESGTGKKAQSE